MIYGQAHKVKSEGTHIGRLKTVNVPVQQNETLKAINSPCLFIKMHKMY